MWFRFFLCFFHKSVSHLFTARSLIQEHADHGILWLTACLVVSAKTLKRLVAVSEVQTILLSALSLLISRSQRHYCCYQSRIGIACLHDDVFLLAHLLFLAFRMRQSYEHKWHNNYNNISWVHDLMTPLSTGLRICVSEDNQRRSVKRNKYFKKAVVKEIILNDRTAFWWYFSIRN